MGKSNSRRYIFVLKIILLFLIINLALPFYSGNTTSALECFAIVYHQGESTNNSGNAHQLQPPAKVDNTDSQPKPTEPVQVAPLPTNQSEPSPSPAPVISSLPTPSPDWGEESKPSPEPDVVPDKETPNPDTSSTPTPDSTTEPDDNEWRDEEIPANAGVLLQNMLTQSYHHEEEKVAYLTFDDGPTNSITNQVLDILKEEDIKATFFTIGTSAEAHPELVRRAYEEGHGLGNHTYSHVFKNIYTSPESFVDELLQNEKVLQSILGEDKIFRLARFPGGSFGKKLRPFRQAVNEAGFGYIDWNSLNGDAESLKAKTPRKLLARLKETVDGQSGLIVLMHDASGKENTVKALPEIISFLREEGYRFELLPGSR